MQKSLPPLAQDALLALGLGVLAAWPAWAWAGLPGLLALAAGVGIGFLGAAAGHLPGALLPASLPDRQVHAALAAIGVRLLVTAALALAVVLADPFPLLPFAVWLVLTYVVLLVLEVAKAARAASRAEPPGAPGREAISR